MDHRYDVMANDRMARKRFKMAVVIRKKKCSLIVANNLINVMINVAEYEQSKMVRSLMIIVEFCQRNKCLINNVIKPIINNDIVQRSRYLKMLTMLISSSSSSSSLWSLPLSS